jgi:3-deoxy-D-manno-octulosonate 8-phosphate phosphatase (KDO 8-P phosphatase)
MHEASPSLHERARKIRLVIFDVDGVLTDGKLFFDMEGREYKSFHARDGHGIKLLQRTGVQVAVISGRSSPMVAARLASLGIQHIYQGQENKLAALSALQTNLALQPDEIAHVGDDLLDLAIMRRVGLAIGVADCTPALDSYLHWKTRNLGGHGAAREVCDLIMDAQDNFQRMVQEHL